MNSGGGQAPSLNATGISNEQNKSNIASAVNQSVLNNVNQKTPFGTLTYNQGKGFTDWNGNVVQQWEATQELTPELQGLFNQGVGLSGRTMGLQGDALGSAQTALGTVNRNLATPLQDQGAFRDQAYGALMDRARTDLGRARSGEQVLLANQGIQPGSEAYRRAMETQDRALVDASNQATIQAGNLAGQNLAQDQAIRNQGMQEFSGLFGLGATGNPASAGVSGSLVNTPQTQIQPTDVTGPQLAAYQGALDQYNTNRMLATSQSNALMGGLFGLAGAGLGGWARGGFGR